MYISAVVWKAGDQFGHLPSCLAEPNSKFLTSGLMRRLTSLGREALEPLIRFEDTNLLWVASCQFGDTERMLRLFEELYKEEPLSPTDFSMSVHNAIIGSFSILTRNQQPYTAVAGGKDTLQLGLLEAISISKDTAKPVGFIYYDGPLPAEYDSLRTSHSGSTYLACIVEQNRREDCQFDVYIDNIEEYIVKNNNDLFEYLGGNDTSFSLPFQGGHIEFRRSGQQDK